MHEIKTLLQQYILENYETGCTLLVSDPFFFKRKVESKVASPVKIGTYAPKKVEKKEVVVPPLAPAPVKKVEVQALPVPVVKSQVPKADFSKVYGKIAPGLKLHEKPPNDYVAKSVKNAWKGFPEAPIFVHQSVRMHSELLKALATAIDAKLTSSRCFSIDKVEEENQWNGFFEEKKPKLILIPKDLLLSSKHLRAYYESHKEIPFLFLESLEQYNDPKLKKVLWQQIVKMLQR